MLQFQQGSRGILDMKALPSGREEVKDKEHPTVTTLPQNLTRETPPQPTTQKKRSTQSSCDHTITVLCRGIVG